MNSVESRRKFLKKAAYAAPVVIALGAMTAPISAHASVICKQGTWNAGASNQFEAGEHYDNVQKAIQDGYLSYDRQAGAYKTTDKFNKTDFTSNPDLKAMFDALFNNA
ncbi:MAG: hypothetical protein JHC35_08575 [Sulfuricurvum sp.]|jgi:hypothetical protein|uniref:hypothetical protein n=1 Tax=Sulfuricurvum sp. TaxID=2025608 RepID=UPI0025FBAA6D|nr:hypothetical protein [Sulfuricurvum sp.]MCI4407317.1 hypothetical protein [Sulfuricurvum sp.]